MCGEDKNTVEAPSWLPVRASERSLFPAELTGLSVYNTKRLGRRFWILSQPHRPQLGFFAVQLYNFALSVGWKEDGGS